MSSATAAGTSDSKAPDKRQLAEREYFNQPNGFPFDSFLLEDVNLPPEEAATLDELDALVVDESGEAAPDTGLGTMVAVDGLPVTTSEKFDKLEAMVRRKFEMHGRINEGCLWMPRAEGGKQSKGYAFIEYGSREDAINACRNMDGHQFDKTHTLRVISIDDLDKFEKLPDAYVKPDTSLFNSQVHEEAMSWMLDPRGRDQFLVQHQREHAVCWNDSKSGAAETFFARPFWSDGPMQWSPLGTYVATLHPQGAALWTSASDGTFRRVLRFLCPGVQKVDFSSHEELVTCYSVQEQRNAPIDVLISVFDCRSGRKLRMIQESLPSLLVGRMQINHNRIVEPFLRWSPSNPPMAAKMAVDMLQVYHGEDMTLVGRKGIAMEGIQDMCWSPSENLIALYQQEHGNLPARVAIISLPDRVELRQKNLFAVVSAKLYWHPQGSYLAVHVEKHTKSRKSTFATIELFTLGNRSDVSNDVLELPSKNDKVLQIGWEPNGDRFAIIHAEQPGRVSVSFYSMLEKSVKESAKLLGSIHNRNISSCHWSPAGRNILLAGLESNTGSLEFFNVDDMTTLRTQAHFLCNNIKWDQTGRFVCTWVDDDRDMEHGYVMWSFTGDMLYRYRFDTFWDFAWRPRATIILDQDTENDIVKNLKTYAKRYDEQDEQLAAAVDTEQARVRESKQREWKDYVASKQPWISEQHNLLQARSAHLLIEMEYKLAEQDVQQILEVKEDVFGV